MTTAKAPAWDLVVHLAQGAKELYDVLLDVARAPTDKFKWWLEENEHLLDFMEEGYPQNEKHLVKITDIKGRPFKFPAQSAALLGYDRIANTLKTWFHTQFPAGANDFGLVNARLKTYKSLKKLLEDDRMGNILEAQKAFKNYVNSYGDQIRSIAKLMNDTYPPKFNYKGFKIENPDHFSRSVVNNMLEGIDALVALFKKRSVLPALKDSLHTVILRYYNSRSDSKNAAGTYRSATREITLLKHILDNKDSGHYSDWVMEVALHEFTHHIYHHELSKEALAFWDAGWDAVYDAKIRDFAKKRLGVLVVDKEDRDMYYDLWKKHNYDFKKLESILEGDDLTKYRHWLTTPVATSYYPDDPALSWDHNQVVLTPYAKEVSKFFRSPEAFKQEYKKRYENDPGYSPSFLEKEAERATDRQRMKYLERMGIGGKDGYASYPTIQPEDRLKNDEVMEEDLIRQQMGFPTPYAGTNPQEDFAETLVTFLLKPERLSKNALYRIQRTLSLSGLYGKPIMQLAQKTGSLKSDIRDALTHLEVTLELPTGSIPLTWFSIKKFNNYDYRQTDDDFYAWAEWDDGELAELSDEDLEDELTSFRGRAFAKRALEWIRTDKWPPIIVVDADRFFEIADGRGRVTVAIGLGKEHLPAHVLKLKPGKILYGLRRQSRSAIVLAQKLTLEGHVDLALDILNLTSQDQ